MQFKSCACILALLFAANQQAMALDSVHHAQGAKAHEASGHAMHIAVIDERAAMMNTTEAKNTLAKLNLDLEPMRAELDDTRQSIEDLERAFTSKEKTLSEAERDNMHHEAEELLDAYNTLAEKIQLKIETVQNGLAKSLQPKVKSAVSDLQRERGVAVVLHRSSVYAVSSEWDITHEVTKQLDTRRLNTSGQDE